MADRRRAPPPCQVSTLLEILREVAGLHGGVYGRVHVSTLLEILSHVARVYPGDGAPLGFNPS